MIPADLPEAWHPYSSYAGDGLGVLVSHGFTGGPASVLPLAKGLAAAGCNVECPLLTGHGPDWRVLAQATAEDWLADLRAALARLKARSRTVAVAGLSMGGTLALRLAQTDPDLRAVALVNHALVFGNPLVPFARYLSRLLPSTPAIASDLMDPTVVEPSCARTPTAGVAQVYRLAQAARAGLPSLRQPLLVFKSRQDHVLPLRNASLTLEQAGSGHKELVWLERSYHVATLDYDQDLILERCLAFFNEHAREPR